MTSSYVEAQSDVIDLGARKLLPCEIPSAMIKDSQLVAQGESGHLKGVKYSSPKEDTLRYLLFRHIEIFVI